MIFPNFLIIGGQRCGTSWLHYHLRQHPEIFLPEHKEPNYWWDQKISWQHYIDLFANNEKPFKGEVSPSYSLMTKEQIGKVYDYNPELKAIFVIRNVFLRSWSAVHLNIWYNRGAPENSERFVEEATDDLLKEILSDDHIRRFSDYEVIIRTWRGVLKEGNLLVMNHTLAKQNPNEFLNQCANFIGAEQWRWDEEVLKKYVRSYGHMKSPNPTAPQSLPVRKSLIPYLLEQYADRVKSLSDYLGQDLTYWIKEFETSDGTEGRTPTFRSTI